MPGKKRILVLEDHPVTREGLKHGLASIYEVVVAKTVDEVSRTVLSLRFDVALIDLMVEGEPWGFEVARWLKDLNPKMAIILITATPHLYAGHAGWAADLCLDKNISFEALIDAIESAIYQVRMPLGLRRKYFSTLYRLMPCQRTVKLIEQTGDSFAERMEGRALSDGYPIVWVVYNSPMDPKRNVISIASCVGCFVKCLFCRSNARPFKRRLSEDELIAQALYGLRSWHAKDALRGSKKLVVNFAGEGDCVFSNLENSCMAVERLSQLEEFGLDFIMTTVGHEQNLAKFLNSHIHLPVTFYWSVNFLDQEKRAKYMPGTAGQSLVSLRNTFQEIGEKTDKIVTLSWVVMKGINDSEEDVEKIRAFIEGRPFEVKVMALEPRSLPGVATFPEDIAAFLAKLDEAHVPYRERVIVGGKLKAGCGTTVP